MGKPRLCSERKILQRLQLIKSLKIAAAAAIAIGLAGELGLKYSATAGIITVLSIQNTKRETLKSAGNRWLAFLCALALSKLSFTLLGYGLWAFGTYLFLFALLCICAGWTEAIAMDSVLVTHFLAEQDMGLLLVANEVLLLLIGTGMGILVNLHLRRREGAFERLAEAADMQMKGILTGCPCGCRRRTRPDMARTAFRSLGMRFGRQKPAPYPTMEIHCLRRVSMNWTISPCGSSREWFCGRYTTI